MPRSGQPNALAIAFQQCDPQLRFQITNLPAERRLRNVKALCRPGKIQLLSHGNKVSQVSQFHAFPHV